MIQWPRSCSKHLAVGVLCFVFTTLRLTDDLLVCVFRKSISFNQVYLSLEYSCRYVSKCYKQTNIAMLICKHAMSETW